MATEPDTLVLSQYGSPLARATRSPYERFPERETYEEFEIYERCDGSRYRKSWKVMRWGGSFTSFGEQTIEVSR